MITDIRTAIELVREDPRRVVSVVRHPLQSFDEYRSVVGRKRTQKRYKELEQFTEDELALNYSFADAKEQLEGIDDQRLSTIAQRSREVFYEFIDGDRSAVDELLGDRTYVLVTGSPRTGGAYTTQKLRQVLCEYRNGDSVVQNEGIPQFNHLHNIKTHYEDALFEMIQWLVWIEEHYRDHDYIVKKCSGFPAAMTFVDYLFGSAPLHIVATTRHPAGIHASDVAAGPGVVPASLALDGVEYRRDLAGIGGTGNTEDLPEWWIESSWEMRVLYYWQQLYLDLVETLPERRRKNFYPVRYGEQDDTVEALVGELAPEKQKTTERLVTNDPFYLTERDYDDFWYSETVRAVIRDVSTIWDRKEFEFPVQHGELAH